MAREASREEGHLHLLSRKWRPRSQANLNLIFHPHPILTLFKQTCLSTVPNSTRGQRSFPFRTTIISLSIFSVSDLTFYFPWFRMFFLAEKNILRDFYRLPTHPIKVISMSRCFPGWKRQCNVQNFRSFALNMLIKRRSLKIVCRGIHEFRYIKIHRTVKGLNPGIIWF